MVIVEYLQSHHVHLSIEEQTNEKLVLVLDIWAKPGSKKEKIEVVEGKLKVFVNERAVDGAANEAILTFVGKQLGIAPSSLQLLSGMKSKFKRISLSYSFTDRKNVDYYLNKLKKIFEREP